jgi:outer membrane protein
MNYRFSIVFILLLWHGGSAHAQQQWTLQQCIDQALKYNIQVKQSALLNDLNKIQIDQNTATMFPAINGGATQNYFFGRSIDPYTNLYTNQQISSNTFYLNGNLTLFEGFSIQNSLKESKLNYLSSTNDLKKVKDDVSINVVNNFLLILYNEELLKIANDQVTATLTQRDRLKRMFELGSINKGNYLNMESQLASDEASQVQAQSQYDQSLLSLKQLLELDTVSNFSIARPEVPIPVFDTTLILTENIYSIALNTQPDVKSSEYKVMSAEKRLAASKGLLWPRLYLNGGLSTSYSTSTKNISYIEYPPTPTVTGITSSGDTVYTYVPNRTPVISDSPFKDQIDNNLGKTVGFTLQIPILNGLSSRSNLSRSKINLQQRRLDNELVKKNLFKSVQQAVADAKSAYNKFKASQRSVDALEETFKFEEKRYDLGLINTYDFLLAKNNLANAKATLLQNKYDYIFRLKILDFYQGKPLTF